MLHLLLDLLVMHLLLLHLMMLEVLLHLLLLLLLLLDMLHCMLLHRLHGWTHLRHRCGLGTSHHATSGAHLAKQLRWHPGRHVLVGNCNRGHNLTTS